MADLGGAVRRLGQRLDRRPRGAAGRNRLLRRRAAAELPAVCPVSGRQRPTTRRAPQADRLTVTPSSRVAARESAGAGRTPSPPPFPPDRRGDSEISAPGTLRKPPCRRGSPHTNPA